MALILDWNTRARLAVVGVEGVDHEGQAWGVAGAAQCLQFFPFLDLLEREGRLHACPICKLWP